MIVYNLVKESTLFYKSKQKEKDYRASLIEPFMLITDINIFEKAKKDNDIIYQQLCSLLIKMKELYQTGQVKYHPFNNFLRELESAGFEINYNEKYNVHSKDKLYDQIELMRMFMCFRYLPE